MELNRNIRLLLVEDDVNLSYLLIENLKSSGFDVTLAQTGRAALDEIDRSSFDICLFDIMLPGIDGFTVATKMKEKNAAIPFIFLTARTLEKDKLHGFELGADDYVTKPFSFKELHCRIMVALRRINMVMPQRSKETLLLGNCVLNLGLRTLSVNGKERKLSQREAELLAILMRHNGEYVSRSEILKQVWSRDDYFTAKSMDVYMTRIRKLLKEDPSLEIENLYGTGYRIRFTDDAIAIND
jgi:two-component system OmpR family response regulator